MHGSRGVWLAFLGCLVAGCTASPRPEQFIRQAPTSADQLGRIVRADTEIVHAFVAAEPQRRVRVLDETRGLFELYGVTAQELEQSQALTDMGPNQLIPSAEPVAADADRATLPDMDVCRTSPMTPRAVITLQTPNAPADRRIFFGDEPFEFFAGDSSPVHTAHGPLHFGWILSSPATSQTGDLSGTGPRFRFTPMGMGLYRLRLIVQDRRGVCAESEFNFQVTSNAPLAPLETAAPPSMELFRHLDLLDAPTLWRRGRGEGITIAIIDSGVNYNHPLLRRNILLNQGERAGNGLDDDGNGFIDDVLGWDFRNQDALPFDDTGHGSHVAGLAASSAIGLAPEAQILAIKALDALGGDAASVAAAIFYAVDRGADVINLSFGSRAAPHPLLLEAMDYAELKNRIVVAAAGNGHVLFGTGMDLGRQPVFPAALPHSNLLAVAATDDEGRLTSYSNFSASLVDTALPGGTAEDPLLSAQMANPKNDILRREHGTSMAAALMSGWVALHINQIYSVAAVDIARSLTGNCPSEPTLVGRVRLPVRIHADCQTKSEVGVAGLPGPVAGLTVDGPAPRGTFDNGSLPLKDRSTEL